MPALQLLRLPNDHTAGVRPGRPTPRAYMADNEEILGLRSLSQFDHFGRTLSGLFADGPDLTPYRALTPPLPWTELNPSEAAGMAKLDMSEADAALDLSGADEADDDLFNRVLGSAIKGAAAYPAPVRLPLLELQRDR